MRKTAAMAVWMLCLGLPAWSQSQAQTWVQAAALEPVLRAELAFAKQAEDQGIRAAFLAWLKPDARVFTPRMVSAEAQYGPEPGDPGHLAWYPEAMGVAASGDLAWSLGPWTYAAKKGGPVLVNGHFLSVWRKQADGLWKVVADIGVPHGAPKEAIARFVVSSPDLGAGSTASHPGPDPSAVLTRLESDLSAAWAMKGGLALEPMLAKEGRVLRPRAFPLKATAEIRPALEADRPGPTWKPALLQVAASGDLGWACGESAPDDQGRSASFLRIWSLEAGTWKVLFDVRLPHPPPPAK
ncbi:nuclear transport factor 2 family protein [Geothrix sp. PMB-07]|uniref:YybH family protein n=1 Tax=Geothrix sp. PMB-07 TaxID=3068640 RepID=UPI002742330C|nr:nuclear transport factor 2 family protein [Geothrix sp. PMB-07]WLT33297.1 nuclear transport factor 2 family protein [Geothrix sp. PMB-07]